MIGLARTGECWRNAYDCEIMSEEPLEFIFVTGFIFPKPIFVKLSEQFQILHFKCVTYGYGPWQCGQGYFNPPKGEAKWEFCPETENSMNRSLARSPTMNKRTTDPIN